MQRDINGNTAFLAVERAIAELRRGRAVYVSNGSTGAVVSAVETSSPALVENLVAFACGSLGLAITAQRASALGYAAPSEEVLLLRLRSPADVEFIAALAGAQGCATLVERVQTDASPEPCDPASAAAIALAKYARLLPAVLTVASPPPEGEGQVLQVSVSQIQRFEQPKPDALEWVSEARVPLAGHEDCRLILFRDARDASEHVAVLIGAPDLSSSVLVRMHSACLTGDLLGSLRCDCGDQLRNAVDQLAAAGGGVLLYLAQEGRGIGLANKLRAYTLQDTGLDTIDADNHLGFRADERSYVVAANMLRMLGVSRIRLLTNNPQKIQALHDADIEVVSFQGLMGAVNRHNVRYIRAKQERAGHMVPEAAVKGSR